MINEYSVDGPLTTVPEQTSGVKLAPPPRVKRAYKTRADQGFASAVCVDVIDLGLIHTEYGPRFKVKLVFEIDERNELGYPGITSRTYNISTYKKADLPVVLESWFGRKLTPAEIRQCYGSDTLINRPCRVHMKLVSAGNGRHFSCIDQIRPSTGDGLQPSGLYQRSTN